MRTRGAVASAVLVALLAGCGDTPIEVDQPRLDATERTACQSLVEDLPAELADERRRLVSPAAAPAAAWGDPPVVLTCGVALPTGFDRFASCVEANGVGWFVPAKAEEDPDAPVTITAAGFRPVVRVEIPAERRPEGVAAAMAGLAAAVQENLELVDPCE